MGRAHGRASKRDPQQEDPTYFTYRLPAFARRDSLYRTTKSHDGFHILKNWGERMPHGVFVFTSNVDGQFQRAGFSPERIVEVHGAIDWLQCTAECGVSIYECDPSNPKPVEVDEQTIRAVGPLPSCPRCGAIARPNILMFGDWGWDERRTSEQEQRLSRWLHEIRATHLVTVECGSGQAISTVRHFCEGASASNGTLIRINPRESAVPAGQIGIAAGALETLQAIDKRLAEICHRSGGVE